MESTLLFMYFDVIILLCIFRIYRSSKIKIAKQYIIKDTPSLIKFKIFAKLILVELPIIMI